MLQVLICGENGKKIARSEFSMQTATKLWAEGGTVLTLGPGYHPDIPICSHSLNALHILVLGDGTGYVVQIPRTQGTWTVLVKDTLPEQFQALFSDLPNGYPMPEGGTDVFIGEDDGISVTVWAMVRFVEGVPE